MFSGEKCKLRRLLTGPEYKKCEDIADGHLEVWEDSNLMKKLFSIYHEGDLKSELCPDSLHRLVHAAEDFLAERIVKVFKS